MHLVQDLSVPAHTRNDGHILYNYETWVQGTDKDGNRNVDISSFTPVFFDSSAIGNTNPLASVPFANLFDTNQYNGTNPDDTMASNIGLSEYTNANFLSRDTIFDDDFPYPAWSSVEEYDKVIDVTTGKVRTYLRKIADGEIIERLATARWFYKYLPTSLKHFGLKMDKKVYTDYAKKLIPRAVGYSAGLLDYFFRGSIEITLPATGAYTFTEQPDQGFTSITLLARNTSSESEEMTDGSIELVVKYKLAQSDPFMNYGYPVPTSSEFSYIVVPEASSIRSIPRESPVELVFDLSNNPLPLWATDVYLQVVYKGRLGLEDGAVAVGFKDICEPTPVDLFNNMDKICLYDTWYNAGSPDAIALVDDDNNGIADTYEWDVYSHDMDNIFFTFLPSNDLHYPGCTAEDDIYIPYLAAGDYHRVFVLSDYDFCFSYCAIPIVHTHPDDHWGFTYFPPYIHCTVGIENQTELAEPDFCLSHGVDPPCYIRHYPTFGSFRGVDNWTGFIFVNAEFPEGSSCPLELLE